MSNELAIRGEGSPLTAAEIRSNVNLIQEVMQAVMKPGVHYGTIPGCGTKPVLFKPGSEKILSTFRIAVEPIVTDLSTPDEAHYRVEARAVSASGQYLGSGIGEASSHEEKYCWRETVCEPEWDSTPEHRRRIKWKGRGDSAYQVKQVRTEAADIANTVLKMAKKRAQIDMTLTVTAASDCFQQDMEDLPEEVREGMEGDAAPVRPPVAQPRRKSEAPKPAQAPASGPTINEGQRKRLYAISMQAGWDKDGYRGRLKSFGFGRDSEIPMSKYDEIVKIMEAGPNGAAPAQESEQERFDPFAGDDEVPF